MPTSTSAPLLEGLLVPPTEEYALASDSAPLKEGLIASLTEKQALTSNSGPLVERLVTPPSEDRALASGMPACMHDLRTCALLSLNCACANWCMHRRATGVTHSSPAPGDMQCCVTTANYRYFFTPPTYPLIDSCSDIT